MKSIKVSNIYIALVDDEDYQLLSQFSWWYSKGYAYTQIKRKSITMQQIIMQNPDKYVDHINHNKLHNYKANLRVVTPSENSLNRKGANRNSQTGIRGVGYDKSQNRYVAHLEIKGKRFRIYCKTLSEAILERRKMEKYYA